MTFPYDESNIILCQVFLVYFADSRMKIVFLYKILDDENNIFSCRLWYFFIYLFICRWTEIYHFCRLNERVRKQNVFP